MKKILLVGKINDAVKGIEQLLGSHFHVQICPLHYEAVSDMLKVVTPDLILISLVGAYEEHNKIFNMLQADHGQVPVLTIGTEAEKRTFLQFYNEQQFDNLIRPVDNTKIMENVCVKIGALLTVRADGSYEVKEVRTRKLVMIVDDNAATLRTIKEMIQDNYDVTVATSGMKALTAMGKNPPDLILLDYEMPVCDGKQTLEMIRADDEFKDIPVIFLTGVSDRAHIEAVLTLKPAGYMLKPAIKEKLLEIIDKTINA
ncbi:MAG: response regulator [Pseudobutyrivibrio sp.]|nr:response regulator [Pseudobutyrivibrio sp.]MBQ3774372.1 response regulator [Pseudobutyrivibrio sp.]